MEANLLETEDFPVEFSGLRQIVHAITGVEQFSGGLHGREDGGREIPWQARAQTGCGARERGAGTAEVTMFEMEPRMKHGLHTEKEGGERWGSAGASPSRSKYIRD